MHVEAPSQTDGRGLKLPYGFSVVAVSMAAAVGWLAGPGAGLAGRQGSVCGAVAALSVQTHCSARQRGDARWMTNGQVRSLACLLSVPE